MNFLTFTWKFLKMLYKFLCCSASLFSLVFNIFWFMCNLASASIPWFTLILIIICIVSKFVRIRSPNEKNVVRILGGGGVGITDNGHRQTVEERIYWPIANHGAGFDAPENSRYALKKCVGRGYRNVLLDAGITACGEIVLINRVTLERAGLTGPISRHTLDDLKKINITEQHPLAASAKFDVESVMTINDLIEFMDENNNLIVFLFISDNSSIMFDKLKVIINKHTHFSTRTILVSRSPVAIYQLRKQYPQLICGLWTEKSLSLAILKNSTLITSIYGAIYRNIIAPVVGISVVFISKDDFNLHIAELWRNVGVRPIVYNVNSPNEKRYFQKTMKTQYLTDSLRSEPHLLMKA